MNYKGNMAASTVQNTDLTFLAKSFLVARHKNFDALINGKVHISGDLQTPKFDGKVTVIRSRIYLPAFENSKYFEEARPAPLLRQVAADSLQSKAREPGVTLLHPTYVDNLRGAVKINFPRNTWLRGPEMNVEIEGTLNLVKNGPDFELFGDIRVVRGTYDLYGNRFDIQKGVFTYEGGLELNPKIDIEARHTFRDVERQKRHLELHITGEMFKPELQFRLDGVSIEEKDAVSYLLFRRSFDELTQGERSELAQQQGVLDSKTARNLLASLVASQLSRTLGKELHLDVIEFQGDYDWRQATIILGKYLTNNLFVSYQRELQLRQADDVVPEIVTLELEITPFLFLQITKGDLKTTGFDLIWKFEK
ncbi:MAG: translocation/assembly module TamB [Calditrichaeota bacterium]|nr:MAG: translocation/assembly module TamB [Calditrichota bacterium]